MVTVLGLHEKAHDIHLPVHDGVFEKIRSWGLQDGTQIHEGFCNGRVLGNIWVDDEDVADGDFQGCIEVKVLGIFWSQQKVDGLETAVMDADVEQIDGRIQEHCTGIDEELCDVEGGFNGLGESRVDVKVVAIIVGEQKANGFEIVAVTCHGEGVKMLLLREFKTAREEELESPWSGCHCSKGKTVLDGSQFEEVKKPFDNFGLVGRDCGEEDGKQIGRLVNKELEQIKVTSDGSNSTRVEDVARVLGC